MGAACGLKFILNFLTKTNKIHIKIKNPICINIKEMILGLPCAEPLSVKVITKLNSKIERISSATAAPRIVTPVLLFSAFIDLSTATEIDTDVAAKITPMNRLSMFDKLNVLLA